MNSLPFWKASSDLGKKVAPLLDLQLFSIGRDILHPAGNRLLETGFTRRRSSEAGDRCSVYASEPVTLWGFGLAYENLYLPRKPYAPRLLPTGFPLDGVWSKRDLPTLPPPATPEEEARLRELLRHAFSWLAEYERAAWEFDPSGRRENVRAWHKKRVPPESLAGRWKDFANECLLAYIH